MRFEVKYSLTEECGNCVTFLPSTLTVATRVEQVKSKDRSASLGRQLAWNLGIVSASKSIVKISASSSTRNGRIDTTRQWNTWSARFMSASSIPSKIRSYVPAKVPGNSSKTCRIRCGRQRRRHSSWQWTHLNLVCRVSFQYAIKTSQDLHPASSLRECLDHELFIFFSPPPHASIRVND
jgi:hypothetical protein